MCIRDRLIGVGVVDDDGLAPSIQQGLAAIQPRREQQVLSQLLAAQALELCFLVLGQQEVETLEVGDAIAEQPVLAVEYFALPELRAQELELRNLDLGCATLE